MKLSAASVEMTVLWAERGRRFNASAHTPPAAVPRPHSSSPPTFKKEIYPHESQRKQHHSHHRRRIRHRPWSCGGLELAPPYVQTELMGEHQASDPRAMPLADYIAEVMEILTNQPDAKEILVKNVYPLRFAGDFNSEKFYGFFEQFNAAMAGH